MSPDPEAAHRLEVRLDILLEKVLLWRIACVTAAIVGVFLVRSMVV